MGSLVVASGIFSLACGVFVVACGIFSSLVAAWVCGHGTWNLFIAPCEIFVAGNVGSLVAACRIFIWGM